MTRRSWLTVAVLCLVCVPVSLFAQAPDPVDAPEVGRRVTFDIVLQNGAPLRMTVREGGIGRIERLSDGMTLGVRPVIQDAENGVVKLEIFGITKREGRDVQRLAGDFELRRGEMPRRVDVGERFAWNRGVYAPEQRAGAIAPMLREITLLGIDLPLEQTGSGPCGAGRTLEVSSENMSGCTTSCCVECDGARACACGVQMSCGSCCCTGCCTQHET